MKKVGQVLALSLWILLTLRATTVEGGALQKALREAKSKADSLAVTDSMKLITLPGDITPGYVHKYVAQRLAAHDTTGAQRAFRILCREGFEGFWRQTRWTTSSLSWKLALQDKPAQEQSIFATLTALFDTLDGSAWVYKLSDTTAVLLVRTPGNAFTLHGLQSIAQDTTLTGLLPTSVDERAVKLHQIGPFVLLTHPTSVDIVTRSGKQLGRIEKILYFNPGEVQEIPTEDTHR